MNRLRDYFAFIIRFLGFGYLALWPLASSGASGAVFGAAILCRARVLDVLCHAPHLLALPPALHALGLLSLLAVAGQFAWRLVRRARHKGSVRLVILPPLPLDRLLGKPALPAPRRRPVQPRDHFGLRGRRPAIGNRSCNDRISRIM
jgi:hypothetical protein